MKRWVCKFAVLFGLLWLAACASTGEVPNAVRNTALPPPDAAIRGLPAAILRI